VALTDYPPLMNTSERIEMDTKAVKTGYLPELDGIRAIAILMVVAVHAHIPFAPGGFIGVDLFFVLSGYLITSILLKEHNKNGTIDFKRFYWRRGLRLLPALTVLLILFIAFGLLFQLDMQILIRDVTIVFFYAASWSRALYNIPPDWLGHTWSLSIEEQLYFLWPLILIKLNRFSIKSVLISLSSFAFTVSIYRYVLLSNNVSTDRIYFGFDTRIDTILFGCILAYLLSCDNSVIKFVSRKIILNMTTIASIAFLLFILTCFNGKMMFFYSYGLMLTGVSSAVIILYVLVNSNGLLSSLLRFPFLVYTGKISYGLYIWHWPIFNYLHSHTQLQTGTKAVIGIIASYAVSALSYYLVERPLLKYKDVFIGKESGERYGVEPVS